MLTRLHTLVIDPNPASTSSYQYFRNLNVKLSENAPLFQSGTGPLGLEPDPLGKKLPGNNNRLTIGYGYDVTARPASVVKQAIDPYLATGVSVSARQVAILDAYRLNTRYVSGTADPLNGRILSEADVLGAWAGILLASEPKASELLDAVFGLPGQGQGFEGDLDRLLGYVMPPSYERAALASLAYNNADELIGPGLRSAIAADERAEAWYEIRYGSNSGTSASAGIAARRFRESDLFGLYGEGTLTVDEAKSVVRTFTRHWSAVRQYEAAWDPTNLVAANGAVLYVGHTFAADRASAEELLINLYAPSLYGVAVTPGTGNVFVGNDVTRTFQRKSGTTVVYSKDDHIRGTTGNDLIMAGDGDDRLRGGAGDDLMRGGFGFDRYFFSTGDGNDVVVDEDGTAQLLRNGSKIALGISSSGGATWVGRDASGNPVTFAEDGADLLITFVGGDSIRFKNFLFELAGDDYAGIRLVDAAEKPTNEVRTFFGDKQDWDSDPNEPGIQTELDAFGNTIRADGQGDPSRPDLEEPDREDFFYGSDAIEVERFVTGGGNDVVYADGAASTTSSQGGSDIVDAGTGSDVVAGGAGNDWIEGGTGGDILGGNEGNDSLFAESSNGGTLTIDLAITQGETGSQRAGQGDLLSGDAGDDVLLSDAGADFLAGGVGEEIIVGGAGDDTIYGDGTVTSALLGWSVQRTRTDVNGVTTVTVGRTGINLIVNDAVGDLDIIYGGAGDDWIFAGAGDDSVEGGIGDDVLFGEAGHDVLVGGDGNDLLVGDSAAVDAAGLSGDDYLVGGAGDDELVGGKGNDYLDGGDGFDRLSGGDGDDTLAGGPGTDVLVGGAGKDTYIFNLGDGTEIINDAPTGGPDDPEASVLVLGPGISPANVKFRPGSLIVDLGNGDSIQFLGFDLEDPLSTPVLDAIEFQSGGFMTLEDVLERGFDIDGTENDDVLFGTPYTDRIDAKGGNDTVIGRAGDDTIQGGTGDDWLEGNNGNDVIDGGEGSDELTGGWGDDTLQGGDGDDALAGDGGNDSLDGGAGADSLVGHDGDDVLNGGTGNDLLIGNAGSDTYTFSAGDGNDLIDEQAHIAQGVADEAGVDVIRFDASVAPGAVTLSRSAAGDLTIGYGTGDTITVIGHYTGAAQAVERIEFDDGSFIDKAALDALPIASIQGTAGADTLSGTSGNDSLVGGAGADSYAMYLGMGRDTLVDASPSAEPGTLALAEGLTLDALKARQSTSAAPPRAWSSRTTSPPPRAGRSRKAPAQ